MICGLSMNTKGENIQLILAGTLKLVIINYVIVVDKAMALNKIQ
jgi:hypothetical protein